MSFNCKLNIRKQKNEIVTKNEKMSFNCKLFICKLNNEIIAK